MRTASSSSSRKAAQGGSTQARLATCSLPGRRSSKRLPDAQVSSSQRPVPVGGPGPHRLRAGLVLEQSPRSPDAHGRYPRSGAAGACVRAPGGGPCGSSAGARGPERAASVVRGEAHDLHKDRVFSSCPFLTPEHRPREARPRARVRARTRTRARARARPRAHARPRARPRARAVPWLGSAYLFGWGVVRKYGLSTL
jgi:hypothetical protein